jgi:ribosomal protein L16 Arg81 hydroxylase
VNLADLIHPLSLADFFVEYFGVRPLSVPGPCARFTELTKAPPDAANPAIAALMRNLERDIEAPILREAGENWPTPPLHRGERDLIALQVAGQRIWRVHGGAAEAPTPQPTFEAHVEAGAFLYIPRGWWRAALPPLASERAFVFTVDNPTGAGLLRWIAAKLEEAPAFQSDIPRFAGPAAQSAYLVEMRHTVMRALRMPDLLQRYCRRLNDRSTGQVQANRSAISHESCISLSAPRIPQIRRRDAETVYVTMRGSDIELPAEAAQLLQFILDRAPLMAGEFFQSFEGEFTHDELVDFLSTLANDGAISIFSEAD